MKKSRGNISRVIVPLSQLEWIFSFMAAKIGNLRENFSFITLVTGRSPLSNKSWDENRFLQKYERKLYLFFAFKGQTKIQLFATIQKFVFLQKYTTRKNTHL